MCEYCKVGTNVYRVKRNFLEKTITHRQYQKFKCVECNNHFFVKLVLGLSLDSTSNVKRKATLVAFLFYYLPVYYLTSIYPINPVFICSMT